MKNIKLLLSVAAVVAAIAGSSMSANPLYRFKNKTNYKVELWADFQSAQGSGDLSGVLLEGKCDNVDWRTIGVGSHYDTTRNRSGTTCSQLEEVQFKVHDSDNGYTMVKSPKQYYRYLTENGKDLIYDGSGGREGKAQVTIRAKSGKKNEYEIVAGAVTAD